jgi:hypothetical protein
LFRINRLFTDWHNKTKSRAMPAGGPCLLYGLPIHTINLYVISGSTLQFLKGIWLADYNISQLSRVFIPKLFGFRESIRKSLADHPAFSKVGC